MAEVKIKTHTTYTYETSDGREFDDKEAAVEWQECIDTFKNIIMLNSKFKPAADTTEAWYVRIRTDTEHQAFEDIRKYNGDTCGIPDIGDWYYSDSAESYVNVQKERDRLQSIIEALDVFGK